MVDKPRVLMSQVPSLALKLVTHHSRCLVVSIGGDAHIMDVWTDPDRRGQGHATDIIKAAMGIIEATGHEIVILHTQVDNEAMQAVAKKFGMIVVFTEVHMEKEIHNE